jgi:hypothetical protein
MNICTSWTIREFLPSPGDALVDFSMNLNSNYLYHFNTYTIIIEKNTHTLLKSSYNNGQSIAFATLDNINKNAMHVVDTNGYYLQTYDAYSPFNSVNTQIMSSVYNSSRVIRTVSKIGATAMMAVFTNAGGVYQICLVQTADLKIVTCIGRTMTTMNYASTDADCESSGISGDLSCSLIIATYKTYANVQYLKLSLSYDERSTYQAVDACTTYSTTTPSQCITCTPGFALVDNYDCQVVADLLPNFGRNPTNSNLEPCSDPKCTDCRQNSNTCLACDTTLTPKVAAYSGSCALTSSLPAGQGLNPLTGAAQACSDSNCVSCQDSIFTCLKCAIVSSVQLYPLQGICVPLSSIPEGMGIDTTTLNILPCSFSSCANCLSDYTKCTSCVYSSPQNYYHSVTNACITLANIPAGYGADITSYQTLPCQSAGCKLCQADYRKCTECLTTGNSATQTYLYMGVWYLKTDIPSGAGPSTTTAPFAADDCSDPNCDRCENIVTSCTLCKTAVTGSLQYYLYNAKCVLARDLPAGTGAVIVTKSTASCQDANCLLCNDNTLVCTACKVAVSPSPQYYLNAGACILPADMPDGLGADLSTLTSRACVDSVNCLRCKNNFLQCSDCKAVTPPAVQYYMYLGLCIPYTSLPSSTGANTVTLIAEACTDANCDDCKANKAVCVRCKVASSPSAQLFAYNGACVASSTLPSGIGPDIDDFVAVACQTAGCDDCKSSYKDCQSCVVSTPQKYAYLNLCYLPANLPSGVGPNLATRAGVYCSDPLCMDCKTDYTLCTKCSSPAPPAPQYYLSLSACVLASSLPDFIGADTVNYITRSCSDPNCKQCQYDYSKCTACKDTGNSATQTYLYNNYCLLPSQLTGAVGANLVTLTAKPCLDQQCILCRNDYLKCDQCKMASLPDPQFYLYNSVCIAPDDIPSGFGADIATGSMMPCTDPNCDDCRFDKDNCTLCKRETSFSDQYFTHQGQCYLPADLPDGFGPNALTLSSATCPTNCRLCKENYGRCTECYQTSGTQYVYNGMCIPLTSVPAGFGAGPSPTYRGLACVDLRCKNCRNDYSVCDACSTSPVMYYLHSADTRCYSSWQIPVGYGPKLSGSNGVTQTCSVPNCELCGALFSQCFKCRANDPPMFLHFGSCILASDLPDQYGGNGLTFASSVCNVKDCKNCKFNYQICVECMVVSGQQKYLDPVEMECVFPSEMPSAHGPVLANKTVAKCIVDHCDDCKTDHLTCNKCDEANGWKLNDGACIRVNDFYFINADDQLKGTVSDVVATVYFSTAIDPSIRDQVMQFVFDNLNITCTAEAVETGMHIPVT